MTTACETPDTRTTYTTPAAARLLGIPLWRVRDCMDRLERRGVIVQRAGQYRLVDGEMLALIRGELARIAEAKAVLAG